MDNLDQLSKVELIHLVKHYRDRCCISSQDIHRYDCCEQEYFCPKHDLHYTCAICKHYVVCFDTRMKYYKGFETHGDDETYCSDCMAQGNCFCSDECFQSVCKAGFVKCQTCHNQLCTICQKKHKCFPNVV